MILGVLVILFITSLFFFLTIFNSQRPSRLIIDSKQNEFTLNFQLDKKKTAEFEKFLEKLDIPYQVENGLSFTLDATSSTYLGLLTPIKIDLDITPNKIGFSGSGVRSVFLKGQTPLQIRIPQNTNIAMFAPDLSGFVTSRLNFTPEVKNIFENTVKNDTGHYLIIFGSKPSLGLFFDKGEFNLSSFKEMPQEASLGSGIKENQDTTTKFYLLDTLSSTQNSESGVFFDLGTHKGFASSIDAAKEIIEAQNTSTLVFPKSKETNTSFILDFKNYDNQNLSDDFITFAFHKGIGFTGGLEKMKSSLSKIKEASVTLKGDTFSGLIRTE